MSCGGMMVHASIRAKRLHEDCWPICCRSSVNPASSGSRTGDAAARTISETCQVELSAHPSARPGQRPVRAPLLHCTRAKSRSSLSRMRLSQGCALLADQLLPRQVHTRVDNARQSGSLCYCTVHGQILVRLLAPTAHGLSKVNAHQLRSPWSLPESGQTDDKAPS
jgi:hypothetical protein